MSLSKEKREPEYPAELETQFIMRLPEEPARELRELLRSGDSMKNRLSIEFDADMRKGEVKFDNRTMHGKIVDLPTVVESMKTIDNKSLYKTADICQMMICKDEPDQSSEEELPSKNKKKEAYKVDKKFLHPHGLTPPTKNARKRRFRKTLRKKCAEAPEIEKEVKRLLRADNEAESVTFEILNEDDESLLYLKSDYPTEPSTSKTGNTKEKKAKGRSSKQSKETASKRETASTSKPETASTSKRDTASTSKRDTASTSKRETASTSKRETASTSKHDTASTSKRDTASTSKRGTASTSKRETASTSKRETASTSKRDTASTSKLDTASTSKQETASTFKNTDISNVVDIFGGAVSDSDLEDEQNIQANNEDSQAGCAIHITESGPMVALGEIPQTETLDFDPQMFELTKELQNKAYTSDRSYAIPSTSQDNNMYGLSFDDDGDNSQASKDSMTMRIEQAKVELDDLKERKRRTQQEIAEMENVTLRKRFQDSLHTLNQEVMYKEMEYQGLMTLQNSEDI